MTNEMIKDEQLLELENIILEKATSMENANGIDVDEVTRSIIGHLKDQGIEADDKYEEIKKMVTDISDLCDRQEIQNLIRSIIAFFVINS